MSSIGNPGSLEAWEPQGLTDERGHPLPILAFPQWLRTSDCQRSTFLSTLRTGPPRTGRAQRKAAALGVGWQPSPDVSAPSREGSPHGPGSPGILTGGRTRARRWPPDPWQQPPDMSTHIGRLLPFGSVWGGLMAGDSRYEHSLREFAAKVQGLIGIQLGLRPRRRASCQREPDMSTHFGSSLPTGLPEGARP
jgi:hypothetical protein